MRYLLDTNICIYLMKEQPEAVARKFATLRVGDVGMSSVTLAELEHGVATDDSLQGKRRTQLDLLLTKIPAVPFDDRAARSYGQIRTKGKTLGRNRFDTLIAAQALATSLILVTNNIEDFQGIDGLNMENWVLPPR